MLTENNIKMKRHRDKINEKSPKKVTSPPINLRAIHIFVLTRNHAPNRFMAFYSRDNPAA